MERKSLSVLPIRKLLIFAAIAGMFCFVLNNTAVVSGMLHPPAGYIPRYVVANLDVPIYLTWMQLAPQHWLLPNLHAPWTTSDSLLSPLVLLVGKLSALLGMTPVQGFQVFHLLFYFAAAFALGTVLWTFCTSRRQRICAAVAIFAALPLPLLALGWTRLFGKDLPLFWIGLIEYSYETADGLFRGGGSNSFTLSFGTAVSLFAIALLTRFVRNRQRRDLMLLALVTFLSGFFHPVEVFVITAASFATFGILAWREARTSVFFSNGAVIGSAAFLGVLPYAVLASTSEWVRDVSRLYQWNTNSVLWVPLVFGIPTILVVYLLLLRFRLPTPGDEVLRTWFLVTVALLFVPGLPLKLHMFDGFSYVAAILLVRLFAGNAQIRSLVARRPRLIPTTLAAGILICVPGYAALYRQVWMDGRSAAPNLLLSAVRPNEEPALIDWLRHNVQRDQLILGPGELAPWLATVPMRSLASHDLFGITYDQQSKLTGDFYTGKLTDREAETFLSGYGIHYVVMPNQSPALRFLTDRKAIGAVGLWTIYEIPEGRRLPYPGLASLRPDLAGQKDFGSLVAAARKLWGR